MKVGDGVIIDGSKLGLNGGLLTGVVEAHANKWVMVRLPRKVERDVACVYSDSAHIPKDAITAIIPDQGHWLGKEMR